MGKSQNKKNKDYGSGEYTLLTYNKKRESQILRPYKKHRGEVNIACISLAVNLRAREKKKHRRIV